MPAKTPFDRYESALLLDGWLKVKSGVPESEVIDSVSSQLRQKAVNQGMVIDDIFRNKNGIKFQLMSMASAFEATDMGKPPSKLFLEIVELYHNDSASYAELLKEAIRMVKSTSSAKNDYIDFVRQQVPDRADADRVIKAVGCIEEFAIGTKVVSSSFFDELTDGTVPMLRKRVLGNRAFTVIHRRSYEYAVLAVSLLEDYINSIDSSERPSSDSDEPKRDLDGETPTVSTEAKQTSVDSFVDWVVQIKSLKPSTAKAYMTEIKFCDEYAFEKGMYSESITQCSSYYDFFDRYSLLTNDREFLKLSEKNGGAYTYVLKLYREYMEYMKYVAATRGESTTMERREKVAAESPVPTSKKPKRQNGSSVNSTGSPKRLSSIDPNREAKVSTDTIQSSVNGFVDWVVQTKGVKPSTAKTYVSVIVSCDVHAFKRSIYSASITRCATYDEFFRKYSLLMNDRDFLRLNEKSGRAHTHVLSLYREYMLYVADTYRKGRRSEESSTSSPSPSSEGEVADSSPSLSSEGEVADSLPSPSSEGEVADSLPSPSSEGVVADSSPSLSSEGEVADSLPSPSSEGEVADSLPSPSSEGVVADSLPSLSSEGEVADSLPSLSSEGVVVDSSQPSSSDGIADSCSTVLSQDFEDGYRLGDYMHQMRFLSCYEDTFNSPLDVREDELDRLLKSVGEVRDGRVFPRKECESTLLSSIYSDVVGAFENGATAVYIECVYERYSNKLSSEMSVYSVESLRDLMLGDSNFPQGYNVTRSTVTKSMVAPRTEDEIRAVLQSSHTPLTYESIRERLWYVPLRTIKNRLVNIPDVVRVDTGTYFFAPNLYISSDEKRDLVRSMHSTIYSKGYIATKELREVFRRACPSAALDSEYLKDYAIREVLKVILGDEFECNSSVVTEKGVSLDIGRAYQNYAAEHERLTLQELKEFQSELGVSAIYWSSVLEEMVRISSTELVHRSKVQFDVDAIDDALERMYPNEYTALKSVTLFMLLPPISVRWNGFVLESYLRGYSKRFRLVQMSVSNDDYFGVMLKSTSKLETYNDVAADLLAKDTSWTDEGFALQCLVRSRLQKNKANKSISAIVRAARQKRINL